MMSDATTTFSEKERRIDRNHDASTVNVPLSFISQLLSTYDETMGLLAHEQAENRRLREQLQEHLQEQDTCDARKFKLRFSVLSHTVKHLTNTLTQEIVGGDLLALESKKMILELSDELVRSHTFSEEEYEREEKWLAKAISFDPTLLSAMKSKKSASNESAGRVRKETAVPVENKPTSGPVKKSVSPIENKPAIPAGNEPTSRERNNHAASDSNKVVAIVKSESPVPVAKTSAAPAAGDKSAKLVKTEPNGRENAVPGTSKPAAAIVRKLAPRPITSTSAIPLKREPVPPPPPASKQITRGGVESKNNPGPNESVQDEEFFKTDNGRDLSDLASRPPTPSHSHKSFFDKPARSSKATVTKPVTHSSRGYLPPTPDNVERERRGRSYREVTIYNLPPSITYAQVSSLIRSGPIQQLTLQNRRAGPATAIVLFCNERDAGQFYNWIENGDGLGELKVENYVLSAALRPSPPIEEWRARHVYWPGNPGSGAAMRRSLIMRSPNTKRPEITIEDMAEVVREMGYTGTMTCERVQTLPGGLSRAVFTSMSLAAGVRKKLAEKGWQVQYIADECEGPIEEHLGERTFHF